MTEKVVAAAGRRIDRRYSCMCGHRFSDHAMGGTKCLVPVSDQVSGDLCNCYSWSPMVERQLAILDAEAAR